MPTITGHAGLAGNTSRDDNDLSALQSLGESGGSLVIANDLFVHQQNVVYGLEYRIVPRSWC